jgi:nucleosome assembly protein 1-like 1
MADPETGKRDIEAEGGEGENEKEFEVEQEDDVTNELTNQLMKNPEVLAALQTRLGMMSSPTSYIASLPKVVKRRLKALKKLQLETTKIEAKFYEEVHALECKYAALYQPFHEKRKLVTSGTYEPTEDECDWPSDDEKEEEEKLSEEMKTKAKVEEQNAEKKENKENADDEKAVGIPDFWLVIFKNVELLSDMVQEHDEPILKHLIDLKVKFSESNPMGFTLEFVFEPNEFFTNTVLTKEYELKCTPDETDPFSFEGPEIIKCKGCTIDWKKGKNVTVKTIKKKQKHKSHGAVRTVTKTVQNDSFFNFFNPPSVPDDDEAIEMDEDMQSLLGTDFEIGHFIRERIIPRAVLYFTGEALEDDDYDEEEAEEEGDDDNDIDDDDDDEIDPDYQSNKDKKQGNPSECKQQ